MTQYYCYHCRESFTGIDPVSFAEAGIPEPVFPLCPKAKKDHAMTSSKLEQITHEELLAHPFFDEFKTLKKQHVVVLNANAPKGSWASKPNPDIKKEPSEQQEEARRKQEKQKADAEVLLEQQKIQQKGFELIQKIDQWINSGKYKQVQARPLDYIYPQYDENILKASEGVIGRAQLIWTGRMPGNHHVLIGPKHDWRNGRQEADFMKDNNNPGGKHIAHIIVEG